MDRSLWQRWQADMMLLKQMSALTDAYRRECPPDAPQSSVAHEGVGDDKSDVSKRQTPMLALVGSHAGGLVEMEHQLSQLEKQAHALEVAIGQLRARIIGEKAMDKPYDPNNITGQDEYEFAQDWEKRPKGQTSRDLLLTR